MAPGARAWLQDPIALARVSRRGVRGGVCAPRERKRVAGLARRVTRGKYTRGGICQVWRVEGGRPQRAPRVTI
eukprot:3828164-Lingulodinium_polyedra.AAC.1